MTYCMDVPGHSQQAVWRQPSHFPGKKTLARQMWAALGHLSSVPESSL